MVDVAENEETENKSRLYDNGLLKDDIFTEEKILG